MCTRLAVGNLSSVTLVMPSETTDQQVGPGDVRNRCLGLRGTKLVETSPALRPAGRPSCHRSELLTQTRRRNWPPDQAPARYPAAVRALVHRGGSAPAPQCASRASGTPRE